VDLQLILNDLADSSVCIGLRMNLNKTKVMFNEHVLPETIAIRRAVLEVVQKYVYLRQALQLGYKLYLVLNFVTYSILGRQEC
jgi:hypothetical protein